MTETYRYPVTATCLTTGAQYHFPSINACAQEGFLPNMVKLCLAGQQESYSGFRFTSEAPRRPPRKPSSRILETVDLCQKGLCNKEIADKMGITIHTVKFNKQRARHMGLLTLGKRG